MQLTPERSKLEPIKTLPLPSERAIPVLGQGTWLMGEERSRREDELASLRLGLDMGMKLIDTAEMYGDGAAEKLIGEAIAGRRAEVFLVSKVLPEHATLQGTIEACEKSLRRLKTDYLDLYLLHWRGEVPLSETLEAFHLLQQGGKILDYGVSNFDQDDMEEALDLRFGDKIVTDQVLYNLLHRGIEWDLLPWCRERSIPIMAYSPIEHAPGEQRGMLDHPQLKRIAARHDATPAQIALAWVLRQRVVVIPKASKPNHVRENRAALDIVLTNGDLTELDRAFPPPHKKVLLETK
jgi:diketogulonate reductase-like aldo/keto reductase